MKLEGEQGHRGKKSQEALLLLLLGALGQILKRVPVDAPDFALDLGWRGQYKFCEIGRVMFPSAGVAPSALRRAIHPDAIASSACLAPRPTLYCGRTHTVVKQGEFAKHFTRLSVRRGRFVLLCTWEVDTRSPRCIMGEKKAR